MQIVIEPNGTGHCVYDESISLGELGRLKIRRGSHVEPVSGGRWIADLSPLNGPILGPYNLRSEALAAERRWLKKYWLGSSPS
ncbi:hypothetical protein OAG51_03475 [Pirellulaceae bacterium]|nr:hypothetical protein [Pirellulaceae bacterium]